MSVLGSVVPEILAVFCDHQLMNRLFSDPFTCTKPSFLTQIRGFLNIGILLLKVRFDLNNLYIFIF